MATRVGTVCRLVVVYICKLAVLDRLQARREELRTLVALDLACTHVLQAGSIRVQTSLRLRALTLGGSMTGYTSE
jgi:hypothetical protein